MLVNFLRLKMVATFTAVFTCLFCVTQAYTQVGIIVKKGDERLATLVEHVLKNENGAVSDPHSSFSIRTLTEIIENDNAASYHRAFCRLISQGIKALVSPATEPHNSILVGYSYEYHIPFITTEMPEITAGLSSPYAVGIRPFTARAMLGLFQFHGWKDVVYLYDHEYGTEKLQFIFLLGYRVLGLGLDGILRVKSAEEANSYLQLLDKSHKNKQFHVILDIDPNLARDIIWRHVNDIYVRKTNFHFVLAQPTPEDFWNSERTAFASTNVTTFTFANHLSEEEKSSLNTWINESEYNFNIQSYYYYDAALVVQQLLTRVMRYEYRLVQNSTSMPKCLEAKPTPIFNSDSLSRSIKEVVVHNGITGNLVFRDGLRINVALNITEITSRGYYHVGTWSDGMLRMHSLDGREVPITLPLIQDSGLLIIVTVINPPFMMLKKTEKNVNLSGNARYEGYLKDMIDLITEHTKMPYEIRVAEDYGNFDKTSGKWTGAIGEIIQGNADLIVADLAITGVRQRVIEFTDPYEMVGFSLVMKNPLSIDTTSSMFYFVTAFTLRVWICIIVSIIIFGVLFHLITKFTGAPDSIESASGIWGRKHAMVVNAWFAIGSSMFQGTGVYPRSISSRVLSGVFWFFTLILSALFIASITSQLLTSKEIGNNNPQLAQLNELSLESIILEAVTNGWPKVGIVYPSTTAQFIKKSKLPTYMKFAEYIENNPDVKVGSIEEGIKRVRESNGNYMVLLGSLNSEYAIHRKPCDVVATHDSIQYAGYGFATRLGSPLMANITASLNMIQNKGILGNLHRKWWIDSNECKNPIDMSKKERTIHVFTGLLCVTAIGFVITFVVFGIQYLRRNKNKETRRQQLSFQDMNLDQTFPQPPPELLADPAPVLNLPEYDRKTLL